jgi:hypothetical protein
MPWSGAAPGSAVTPFNQAMGFKLLHHTVSEDGMSISAKNRCTQLWRLNTVSEPTDLQPESRLAGADNLALTALSKELQWNSWQSARDGWQLT